MHEMSIATQLIAQVLDAAEQNNATRVTKVCVELGMMQLVVPEALRAAFEACAESTCAEAAELVLTEVTSQARCRNCDTEFEPTISSYICPDCSVADAEIIQGKEIILTSMECDI